jgi:hypothetical protein
MDNLCPPCGAPSGVPDGVNKSRSDSTRIRDRPSILKSTSDTVYIRGIARIAGNEELLELLSTVATPLEVDFSTRGENVKSAGISGQVWAKYPTIKHAADTLTKLHNFYFHGVYLSVKFELGLDRRTGKRMIASENFHSTVIRRITRRNTNNKTTVRNNHDYSSKSIVVNNTDYPFPTGLYLTRVIGLCAGLLQPTLRPAALGVATSAPAGTDSADIDLPPESEHKSGLNLSLMNLAVNTTLYNSNSVGNNGAYAKETAEAMAMVDGLERALKHLHLRSTYCPVPDAGPSSSSGSGCSSTSSGGGAGGTAQLQPPVNVYVLGDGVYPLCAALIALHFPHCNWQYHSIDPLLQPIAVSGDDKFTAVSAGIPMRQRFHQFSGLSQDYPIPPLTADLQLPRLSLEEAATTPYEYVPPLSVVIAYHSHAPLEEFWGRLPSESYKLAVTMNCCAEYCILHEPSPAADPAVTPVSETSTATAAEGEEGERPRAVPRQRQVRRKQKAMQARNRPVAVVPLLEYEDFEVYSPRRTIRVYAEACFSSPRTVTDVER